MIADASPAPNRWDDAGRAVAPLLDDRTCIVVVGEFNDDAARVAIALAHAHGGTRRVAIVDAIGDLAPLQKLLPNDAGPHGVIDHFLHGVSLRKIAQPVNLKRTLFVVPSGAGPFDYGTLLRRERWRRLTMAFRGEGALLCILLPRDAEGLVDFVEDTDGVVVVGDVEYPEPRHVIANVQPAGRTKGDASMVPRAAPARWRSVLDRWTRQASSKRPAVLAASVVALAAIGALFAWGAGDDGAREAATNGLGAATPSATQTRRAGMIAVSQTDSANAALYSVDMVMLNSLAAASRHLTDRLAAMPAATFSPVHLGADSARWYRLLVGAWAEEREADSALVALRRAGVLPVGVGSVRRTPFAVRVADSVSPALAITRAIELRAQGLPAYALGRDEDHASVYAGAFETPSQAMTLLDMFKRAGIDATVAYRIGRGI
jgi:hypothetical protein